MQETALDDDLRRLTSGIIAIDGHLGAGKTWVADRLGQRHGLPVVHVDDYLLPGRRAYVAALRLTELAATLGRHRGKIIIEGVCLLDVLARVGREPALHLFVHDDRAARGSTHPVAGEVTDYVSRTNAPRKAKRAFTMKPCSPTNQYDVEITYLKLRALLSCTFATGGIAALLVGALLLATGADAPPSTLLVVGGLPLTVVGLGLAALASSLLWVLLAYAARPAPPPPRPTVEREPRIAEPLHLADRPADLQAPRIDIPSSTLRVSETAADAEQRWP